MATREDRLLGLLRKVIGPPPQDLTPTASLLLDLGMDELDVVELVVEMEQEFTIAIDEEEGDGLKTWGNVVKLMQRKVDQKREAVDGILSERSQQYTDAGRTV